MASPPRRAGMVRLTHETRRRVDAFAAAQQPPLSYNAAVTALVVAGLNAWDRAVVDAAGDVYAAPAPLVPQPRRRWPFYGNAATYRRTDPPAGPRRLESFDQVLDTIREAGMVIPNDNRPVVADDGAWISGPCRDPDSDPSVD